MSELKKTCSLPWTPEELAQIRRERANFDEEHGTHGHTVAPQVIICEECDGKGQIFDDGLYRECPVCDGDPRITFQTVKEYARQITEMSKKLWNVKSTR